MEPFDRLFKQMLRPWVAAGYVGFVILSFFFFDRPVAWFFHGLDLTNKLPFLHWLTRLGVSEFYVIGLFLFSLFFRYVVRNKTWEARCWFLWLCVLVPYLVCGVVKVLLGRARPELLFSGDVYGFYGFHTQGVFWSFPSGHTTVIMSLVSGLSILFPRHFPALFTAGVLVVSTRILLTQHYLSDVFASSVLALLEVGLVWFIVRRQHWLEPAFQSKGHVCHECT